jgi:hypothetical protein
MIKGIKEVYQESKKMELFWDQVIRLEEALFHLFLQSLFYPPNIIPYI